MQQSPPLNNKETSEMPAAITKPVHIEINGGVQSTYYN